MCGRQLGGASDFAARQLGGRALLLRVLLCCC